MDVASLVHGFISWSESVAAAWGYPGIFLVNFVGSATIIFPTPAFFVVFMFGAILNPWLVGLVAAFGSALGELTGYVLGLGGKRVIEKKHKRWLDMANEWMEKHRKHGTFLLIVAFAATPLPDDVLGVFCGAVKYDIKRFFIASLIGKIVMSLGLAFGGYFGINWVLNVFIGGG